MKFQFKHTVRNMLIVLNENTIYQIVDFRQTDMYTIEIS